MTRPRAVRSIAPDDNEPVCEQAQALDRLTAELKLFREAGERWMEELKPAADALAGLGEAQAKFCNFLVKHRVKIVLGFLGAATGVGAISPTMAEGIKTVLVNMGLAQ